MVDAILKGVLFGLVLAMLIGPVFFSLIETSIEKGFIPGLLVAIGITFSDTVYILISYFGLTTLLDEQTMEKYLGFMGGLILVGFGVFSFFKSRKRKEVKLNVDSEGFKRFIAKGFMINGLNPMVLFFWVGAISLATVEYELKENYILIFFISIIVTVFSTDLLKVYLAHKLRVFVTPGFIKIMNILTGIVMVIFGIRLFIYAGPGI